MGQLFLGGEERSLKMLWRLADGIAGTVFPFVFPLGWNRLETRYYSRKKSVYPWGTGISREGRHLRGKKSDHVMYGGTCLEKPRATRWYTLHTGTALIQRTLKSYFFIVQEPR